jgi:predicted nucleic acid-binding protein
MIIEAAIKGGAAVIVSEDLQDGQVVSGVTIRNPFTI